MNKKQPAFSRRLNHIRISVWPNFTERKGTAKSTTWYTTEIRRRYYSESEKEWHDSYSLNGVADVTLAIEALEQAREFIRSKEAENDDMDGGSDE